MQPLLALVPKQQFMIKYFLVQAVQEPTSTWAVVKNGEEGNLVDGSLSWTWEAAPIDGTYLTGTDASVGDPLIEVKHGSEGFALYQKGSGENGLSAFASGVKLCPIAITHQPGDGYDNDCDGRTDEESSATSDEDGDGKTGEDRRMAEEATTQAEISTADDGNSTENMTTGEMTKSPAPNKRRRRWWI